MTTASPEAPHGFILALARALHRYGTPADRLEEALQLVAARLGLRAEFFSTPTTIIVTFGDPAELRTSMLRCEGGELDMGKLARLDALATRVAARQVDPAEGLRQIQAIESAHPTWSAAPMLLASGVATACVAVFFHGSLTDVAIAGALGVFLGVLSLVIRRSTTQARVFELLGAFLASFVGHLSAAVFTGASSSVITLAGMLVLLPGLSLTVAMTELATRNLISGTARLMAAIIVLLQLTIGVAVGEAAARALTEVPRAATEALPLWSEWAAAIISSLAMVVVVRAEGRAAPWIVLATLTGFVGTRTGADLLGPRLGVMVGAFALGLMVNLYARLLDRPAQVVLVPAMLILVPGSLGFRGIASLLDQQTLSGVETTFGMFVVAMAIVAGLLMASATLPPRRVL